MNTNCLISITLSDEEQKVVDAYKAAPATVNDKEARARLAVMVGKLAGKACTMPVATREVLLMVAAKVADHLVTGIKAQYADDSKQVAAAAPLEEFADSFKAAPAQWLVGSVSSKDAANLGRVVAIMLSNSALRNRVLADVNKDLEQSIPVDGAVVIIGTTVSEHTKQVLKPMSKRDLTAQLEKVAAFVEGNPDGFTFL